MPPWPSSRSMRYRSARLALRRSAVLGEDPGRGAPQGPQSGGPGRLSSSGDPRRDHGPDLRAQGIHRGEPVPQEIAIHQPTVEERSAEFEILGSTGNRLREPEVIRLEAPRSEEHTSELQSPLNLVCR